MVEYKKLKNKEEEVLKYGKWSPYTHRKSFQRFIQDVLKLWI